MAKTKPKDILQKVLIIVGGLSFLVGSVGGMATMLDNSSNTEKNPQQEQASEQDKLKQQAEGYKLVLKREPDNPFVIKELLGLYIKLQDFESALPLAQKLVALEPENGNYAQILTSLEQRLGKSSSNSNSQNNVKTEEEK